MNPGDQDAYLTVSPEVSYWKHQYRRYSAFQLDTVECSSVGGSAAFGKQYIVEILRSGDLLTGAHLEIDLPAVTAKAGENVSWPRDVGHAAIDNLIFEIGTTQIDKQYGQYMALWDQLTLPAGKEIGHAQLIGNTTELTTPAPTLPATTLLVPLQFWWCRTRSLALPLLNLYQSIVRLKINFRKADEVLIGQATSTPQLADVRVYAEYVFLDEAERKDFLAQPEIEMLIDVLQVDQSSTSGSLTQKVDLKSFNHPVGEMLWTVQPTANTANGANRWTDFSNSGSTVASAYEGGHTITDATFSLNGQERLSKRGAVYWGTYVPYRFHSHTPSTGVYNHSWSLNPESPQPSGTQNFSRVEQATLTLGLASTQPADITVYGRTLNILKIKGGGGSIYFF